SRLARTVRTRRRVVRLASNMERCSRYQKKERGVVVTGDPGAQSKAARYLSLFLSALTVGLLLLAFVLLPLHFISYSKAKPFFDWLAAARGGSAHAGSYLTEDAHNRFFGRLPIATAVFLVCGVTLAFCRRSLARFLLAVPAEWARIRGSLREQFP